ncbi:MAG: O-antigen ligase family protein [Rubrobacteraceae bacterium]
MGISKKKPLDHYRVFSTVALILVVLLASWMGHAYGGYFVGDWGLAAFVLAALMLVAAVGGALGGASSWWSAASTSVFIGYAAWTFASLMWSANRGDAWLGAGLTLFYLLAFWLVISFVALGASRRRVLVASAIGPGLVAAFMIASGIEDLFRNERLLGSVGYYNGQAAFLLVPFWVGIYAAGSRRISPVLRGLALAGAVLGAEVAVLTQSRGALVAMAVSLPVFFLFSGQRLRGLMAFLPVAAATLIAFPGLNEVYLQFLNEGSPEPAIERATSTIWLTTLVVGLYGLSWGLVDRRWRPPDILARAGGIAAAVVVVSWIVVGGISFVEREGDPVVWGQERWEAFRSDDTGGQDESRYLSAGGSGRYTLWEVAWRDFASNPILGVGTHNYEATFYQERTQPIGYVHQPHNLPLEVLAERGIVGGAMFFGFLGVCVAAGLWSRFRKLNAEGKAQVGAMLAAVTYWFVHSSAEWFWQIPAVTLPAVIYLAMLVAPWERPAREADDFASSELRLAGVGIAFLMAVTVTPLYVADNLRQSAAGADNPWESLSKIELAQRFNPLAPELARREAELAIQIGDIPRATQAYAREVSLNPEHYAAYVLLAGFYERLGSPERALELYEEALRLSPLDRAIQDSVSRVEERLEEQREGD